VENILIGNKHDHDIIFLERNMDDVPPSELRDFLARVYTRHNFSGSARKSPLAKLLVPTASVKKRLSKIFSLIDK
jgi:hypothetical protein